MFPILITQSTPSACNMVCSRNSYKSMIIIMLDNATTVTLHLYHEAMQLWTIIRNNFLAGKLRCVTKAITGELFSALSVSHKPSAVFLTSGLLTCWYQLSQGKNTLERSVKLEFDGGTA